MRRTHLLSALATFLSLSLTPGLAFALTFEQLVNTKIVPLVDEAIVPLLYIVAFLVFLIGIVRYFFTGGAENREAGKAFALWGIIGMVAIFGIWGVVRVLLTVIPAA